MEKTLIIDNKVVEERKEEMIDRIKLKFEPKDIMGLDKSEHIPFASTRTGKSIETINIKNV